MKIEILAAKELNLGNRFQKEISLIDSDNGLKIHSVESSSTKELLGLSSGELVEISIAIGSNIFVGMLTNLIYDLCKNNVRKIWINDDNVEIQKSEIETKIKEVLNEDFGKEQEQEQEQEE